MSDQTQQQKKNRKVFSKTIKTQIRRKPHTQPIDGVQYTYGLLQKKSQSSLFNNERFLIIKGHQTFGYASKLPDETLLPFLKLKNIPKCKIEVPLDKLEINNQKEILVVQFTQDNKKEKNKWEFKCDSKVKAIEWRQKLEGAKNQRIANLQNNAVKVILEDINQNMQESQTQHKNQLQIVDQNSLGDDKQHLKANQQGKSKFLGTAQQEQRNKPQGSNTMMRQSQVNQSRQTTKQPYKNSQPQSKIQIFQPSTQKFPQINIFQSLISKQQRPQQYQSSSQKQQQQQGYGPQLKQKYKQPQKSQQNRAKEQFLKRKKEQLEAKSQLQGQSNSMLKNVLTTLNDQGYQIQKIRKQWGYQFAKGVSEYEVIQSFKVFVQTITTKIVDQLALQPKKRYYKPVTQTSQTIRYEIQGIYLQFYLNQLTEVSSFEGKGSIISNLKVKQAYQQLKNYDYILQLTNNKGRIRVPLAMCVEYKGFVALAKAIIPQSQSYQNMESLQKQLDLLQAQSRINNSLFQDNENGRIIPAQSKVYEKLSRAQNTYSNDSNRKFDICYMQNLKHYLPQDFFRYFNTMGDAGQGRSGTLGNANWVTHVLRRQLIQDEEYEDVLFCGDNMVNALSRLKIPQNLKEDVDTLTEVAKTITDRVHALVIALQNLDQVITNSKDISKLMHGYGLNIRYLGMILEQLKQPWLKSLITSQIAARCAKYFLKFDLQDCILNLNETKIQNIRRYQIKQVISFLNKLLGNSEQSQQFWKQLSRQSQQYFLCYLDRAQINIGFFVQSLQYQCRVRLVSTTQTHEKIFKNQEPFTEDNFVSFVIKSKNYDLSFCQLYRTVNKHLKDLSQESFQQLSILLNLQRKNSLPSHFSLNDLNEQIISFMINWLSPTQGRAIYYPQEIKIGEILPSKSLYQIKLTQIKWLLKSSLQQQAEQVRNFLTSHVNKYLGEYHPILSQLYDLFSRYYLGFKSQEKKSITYCKSSIKNVQKLLGMGHTRSADNYFMLAEIYINYQKKRQALGCLKKAKQILEQSQGQQTQAYGVISLRMGQILLASNLVKEALQQGVKAYVRLAQSDDLEKFIQCIELISRCYQVADMWKQYSTFTKDMITNTNRLELLSQDPFLLERCIKVLILPHFNQLSRNLQVSRQVLSVLSSFASLSNLTSSVQNSSFNYIKSLILSKQTNRAFPKQFISIINNDIQQLLDEIQSSGIMTRWKGFENIVGNKSLLNKINSMSGINSKSFEFIAMLEALAVFVGEGWIQGVVRFG